MCVCRGVCVYVWIYVWSVWLIMHIQSMWSVWGVKGRVGAAIPLSGSLQSNCAVWQGLWSEVAAHGPGVMEINCRHSLAALMMPESKLWGHITF